MPKWPRRLTAAVTLRAVVVGSPASAQQSSCRAADSVSAGLMRWVTRIATSSDPASTMTRNLMQIPQVSANKISYVTSNTVCSKIVGPYNSVTEIRDSTTDAPIAPSGQLYVIKVGTVYVALDPVKSV